MGAFGVEETVLLKWLTEELLSFCCRGFAELANQALRFA